MHESISIVLAEDHTAMREALAIAISTNKNFKVTGQAANGAELLCLVKIKAPDIILLDLRMPVMSGEDAFMILRRESPQVKVIVLSEFDDPLVVSDLMKRGASAYLVKSCGYEKLISTIEKVSAKGFAKKAISDLIKNEDKHINEILTGREIEVLKLYSDGFLYKEIAVKLFISIETIKYHMKEIHRKTKIYSLQQLVKYAIRNSVTGIR